MSDLPSLLKSAIVRIERPDGGGGTGFFVAPGVVVSCAHVTRVGVGSTLSIRYLDRILPGTVVVQEPEEIPDDGLTPYPDVGVIALQDAPDHACALIDQELPALFTRLHTQGFTQTLSDEPRPESAGFTYVGPHDVPGGSLLKLIADEAVGGMSGGPLLDLTRRVVCGMLKTSREPGTDRGGWGVPISAVIDLRPDLVEANGAFHAVASPWVVQPDDESDFGLAAAAVEGYRLAVEDLAPTQLRDRDIEIGMLGDFCTGSGSYMWWQAEQWAGKTALLMRFALSPPAGVAVVYFFVAARIATESDSAGFLYKMVPQLAALAHYALPDNWFSANQTELYYRSLLNRAASRVESQGRRLALIVDGLDEDTGPPQSRAIATLLPKHPHPNLRIIVASRAGQEMGGASEEARGRPVDLLGELPTDHPLTATPVTVLAPSPHARDIERLAKLELQRLLRGEPNQRDLIGLLTVAQGGLTIEDLVAITAQPPDDIGEALARGLGRSLKHHAWPIPLEPTPEPGLVLGHNQLHQQARHALGDKLLAGYLDQIHAWANVYVQQRWPASTPIYLLLEYPFMLKELGDHDGLYTLAVDSSRHERLYELTTGDATALSQINITLEMFADQREPDLGRICQLARTRDGLTARNTDIPDELLGTWIHLGHIGRAIATARSKARAKSRHSALAHIAAAMAEAANIDRAVGIVGDIADERVAAETLATVAQIAARAGETSAAEDITLSIPVDYRRAQALATIAVIATAGGVLDEAAVRFDKAEQVANSIPDPLERCYALHLISEITAEAGETNRALALTNHAESTVDAISDEADKVLALSWVVSSVAHLGDIPRATALASRAEELAKTVTNDGGRALAQAATAECAAYVGDVDRAFERAIGIAPWHLKSEAMATIAKIAVQTGHVTKASLCVSNAGHADDSTRVLNTVTQFAAQRGEIDAAITLVRGHMHYKEIQPDAWSAILKATAQLDVERALELVKTIRPHGAHEILALEAEALAYATVAEVVASQGDTTRAEGLCQEATSRLDRAAAARRSRSRYTSAETKDLASFAEALAKAGETQGAARLANTLTSIEIPRTVAIMAQAAAEAGDVTAGVELAETAGIDRDPALATIAGITARAGDIVRAVQIGRSIRIRDWRVRALSGVVETVAKSSDPDSTIGTINMFGDDTALMIEALAVIAPHYAPNLAEIARRAEELGDSLSHDNERPKVLAAISQVVALTGDIDRALQIADSISDRFEKDGALQGIAEHMAMRGEFDRAVRIADTITTTTIMSDNRRGTVQRVAEIAVEGGDFDRAAEIGDTLDADYRDPVLTAIAVAKAKRHDVEDAIALAHNIADEHVKNATLRSVAAIVARSGGIDRAVEIAETMSGYNRDQALEAISLSIAGRGDWNHAVEVSRAITERLRIRTLVAIAETQAETGDVDAAAETAEGALAVARQLRYTGEIGRIGAVLAKAGRPDRVEEIAATIEPTDTRSYNLHMSWIVEALSAHGYRSSATRLAACAWRNMPWTTMLSKLPAIDMDVARTVVDSLIDIADEPDLVGR